MESMPLSLKIFLCFGVAVMVFALTLGLNIGPQAARAQTGVPVGGFFLPGLYDIYTPIVSTSSCNGVTVSVVGPNPGTFYFAPVLGVYDYFPEAISHVGVNMVGLSEPTSPCGIPTLAMFGSSLTPGP